MDRERIQIETPVPSRLSWVAAVLRFVRREVAYHLLVQELSDLSPQLLADTGVTDGDIRRFARAATSGKDLRLAQPNDGPMTTIGSRDWTQTYLLRLGSN